LSSGATMAQRGALLEQLPDIPGGRTGRRRLARRGDRQ
jgi:hypothetical protein